MLEACGGYARTFTYSSTTLQLTSKCEPETGTTSYTYNADGTVKTKTMGAKVINYSYDSYGRYTGYSAGTGDGETVVWDTNTLSGFSGYGVNAYGRVAYRRQNNCAGLAPLSCIEAYNYTPSGHMTAEELTAYSSSGTVTAPTMQAGFTYDNEGRLASTTYPAPSGMSAPTYTYSFDALGRPSGMANGSTSVASGGAYNAAGQITSLAYLGGTETRSYNSLNQLTGVQLGSSVNLSYFYNAGYNNGQMASSVDSVHGQTVEYSYDALKRLTAAYYTTLSLTDPGFEQTSVNGWSLAGQAATTDLQYRSWPYSLQASGGAATATGVCSASATYTVNGYYLTAGGSSGTVTTMGAVTATEALAPATSWTAFSYAFVGPASCTGSGVSIALGGGQPNGSVYFDDISLTSPSVSSGANQISNPGFTLLTVSWNGSNARLTETLAHSGETSMLTVPAAWISQTISGLTANATYTVSAYVSGGPAKLTVGSGSSTVTASSGWAQVTASGQASSTGTLTFTALASGSGNVYWDDFSMNAAGVAGGQQFGYDGFGNLLSQMPIFGTAPMMSLAVNPNTNEVTSGGAVYDGAGNLTSDGTNTYTFDAMNRMTSDGLLTYSYRPGDNKEMAAYYTGTANEPPFLTLFLRDPSGRLLATSSYTKTGSSWYMTAGSLNTRFYLGGKALNYAENNVGSTASSTFWPYGGLNTGTGGVFGTYQPANYMYYADQRYYYSNWGRFSTADPSNANINLSVSGSWNRYAYLNGDPINAMDPTGQDLWDDGFACGDIEGSFGGYGGGIAIQVGQAADDWMNEYGSSPVFSCVGDCETNNSGPAAANDQTTTLNIDLTNGVVAQAGGSYGPANGSLSYVPSTGNVYVTGAVGPSEPATGLGAYVAVGLTSNPDQSGPSIGASAFAGVGGTLSVNPSNGDYTWGAGLGTPGVSVSQGETTPWPFPSLPPAVFPVEITAIPPATAVPIGGGLYWEEQWP